MALALNVSTEVQPGKVTLVAEIRHGPAGKWYRSEVDIVDPMTAMDLPEALRQLGDELARNLSKGGTPG